MARLCLALLRNLKCSHIVVDKSVRNFDVVCLVNLNLRDLLKRTSRKICPFLFLDYSCNYPIHSVVFQRTNCSLWFDSCVILYSILTDTCSITKI